MDALDADLPELTAAIIEDDQELAEVVDALVLYFDRHNPELVFLREEVRLQEELLRVVAEDAWAQYLRVEEVTVARTSEMLLRVVRWAFSEGERHGRRCGGWR